MALSATGQFAVAATGQIQLTVVTGHPGTGLPSPLTIPLAPGWFAPYPALVKACHGPPGGVGP